MSEFKSRGSFKLQEAIVNKLYKAHDMHWFVTPPKPTHFYGYSLPELVGYDKQHLNAAEMLGIVLPEADDDDKYELNNGIWLLRSAMMGQTLVNLGNPFKTYATYTYMNAFFWDVDAPKKPTPPIVKSEIEDYVVGYRSWKIQLLGAERVLLKSAVQDYLWAPGEPARGLGVISNTSAGIYAYEAEENQRRYEQSVYGTVALWGKVFVHADGTMRGEYAYPLQLWVDARRIANAESIGQALAREYGVEVGIWNEIYDEDDD